MSREVAGVGAFHVIPINVSGSTCYTGSIDDSARSEGAFSRVSTATLSSSEDDNTRSDHDGTTTDAAPPPANRKRRRKAFIWALFFVVLVLAVAVAVVSSNPSGTIPDKGNEALFCDARGNFLGRNSQEISRSGRYHALKEALENTSQTHFHEPCTPKDFALTWLADHDELQLQPDEASNSSVLQQRFAVAVFFLSTNSIQTFVSVDTQQISNSWLISSTTECNWMGIACRNDTVTGIWLSDLDLEGTIPYEFTALLPNLSE
jgi:hypothetical protein